MQLYFVCAEFQTIQNVMKMYILKLTENVVGVFRVNAMGNYFSLAPFRICGTSRNELGEIVVSWNVHE